MINKFLPLFLLNFFYLFVLVAVAIILPIKILAVGFELTDIGASSTAGQSFSQWTYYGFNPEFKGTATPGEEVGIQVDGTAETATALATGEWTWQPTNLGTLGSYEIVLSSAGETQSFTLIIAESTSYSSGTSATTSTTPAPTTTVSTSSGSTTTTGPTPATAQPGAAAETLPQTGSVDTTFILTILGLMFLGGGMIATVFLPKPLAVNAKQVSQDMYLDEIEYE